MNYSLIFTLLGSILLLESATMVPSLGLALYYGDGDAAAFVWSILITAAAGLLGVLLCRPEKNDLRLKEGLMTVALAWVLLSIFGSLPFLFSGVLPRFVDALCETVSGFTTTGASVMTRIDELYGNFDNYITQGLHISEEEKEQLRQMYLE